MDITIQKAVELGVSSIVPLLTTRCGVHLSDEKADKRHSRWTTVSSRKSLYNTSIKLTKLDGM